MDKTELETKIENVRQVLTGICDGLEEDGFILHSVRFVREEGKTHAVMNYENKEN